MRTPIWTPEWNKKGGKKSKTIQMRSRSKAAKPTIHDASQFFDRFKRTTNLSTGRSTCCACICALIGIGLVWGLLLHKRRREEVIQKVTNLNPDTFLSSGLPDRTDTLSRQSHRGTLRKLPLEDDSNEHAVLSEEFIERQEAMAGQVFGSQEEENGRRRHHYPPHHEGPSGGRKEHRPDEENEDNNVDLSRENRAGPASDRKHRKGDLELDDLDRGIGGWQRRLR